MLLLLFQKASFLISLLRHLLYFVFHFFFFFFPFSLSRFQREFTMYELLQSCAERWLLLLLSLLPLNFFLYFQFLSFPSSRCQLAERRFHFTHSHTSSRWASQIGEFFCMQLFPPLRWSSTLQLGIKSNFHSANRSQLYSTEKKRNNQH